MKKQLGFSLPEAMVASVLLAIVVGGVMTMVGDGKQMSNIFVTKIQGNNVCLAEANSILSGIKERGLLRNRFNFPFHATDADYPLYGPMAANQTARSTPAAKWAGAVEAGINFTHRWPTASPVYEVPSGSPANFVIRPNLLIMGYMNAIQSIYMSNKGDYCSNAANFNGSTNYNGAPIGVINAARSGLINPVPYIKIIPFDTLTGALDTTCPNFHVRPPRPNEVAATFTSRRQRPPGLSATNHPDSPDTVVFTPQSTPAVRADLGYVVTIKVIHQDRSGNNRECSVSERFQYGMQPENNMVFEFSDIETTVNNSAFNDTNVPQELNNTVNTFAGATPSFAATTTNYTDAPYLACSAAVGTRNIALRLTNTRPGSIHMCRNLSALRPATGQTGTNPIIMNVFRGIRTTFYSSELIQHAYYAGHDNSDGLMGDLYMTGLYYPAGTYYCYASDGCQNMPRFPNGSSAANPPAAPTEPGGAYVAGSGVDAVTRYYTPSNHNAATTAGGQWQPCESIQIACGAGGANVSATYAAFQPGNHSDALTTNDRDAYHLRFNGLSVGCDVHIQIAEVDAGYNIKATEFREYIQEQAPGNWMCRSGNTGMVHPANQWFFACAGAAPIAQDCRVAPAVSNGTTPCCMPYPFYPTDPPPAFRDP